MMVKEIVGKVINKKSQHRHSDGNRHIYSSYIELEPYQRKSPNHFDRNIDNWIRENFDLKNLDRKKIRITAEVIDV